MSQFISPKRKTRLSDYSNHFPVHDNHFPIHDETTNPSMPAMGEWPPYPKEWDKPQNIQPMQRIVLPTSSDRHATPSIPTIVGYLTIGACLIYTILEIACLLSKAFPQAVK